MKTKIFWCKVNKYFTEEWINSNYLKNKKGFFVATCVVTDKAKRKWIKFIRDLGNDLYSNNNLISWFSEWKLHESQSMIGRVFERTKLKKINYYKKIYISWCWAFIDWKVQNNFYNLYPELTKFKDIIVLLDEVPKNTQNKFKNKIKNLKLYTKKFVIIQSGCDSFCSFCLTVKKRWRHFSRTKEDILKEILDFEKSWWKEVVLTGINLWAWELKSTNDLKSNPKISELLKYLLENSNIKRIRISSLWPEFIDDELISLFKETRIYPHFHLSIQSWSSNILKSMKRHYDSKRLKKILTKIKKTKRKDKVKVSLWADIIVWFPWEIEKDFLKTYNLVKDFKINKLHCFPFSAHKIWENVIAWDFENQIPEKEKKERLKKLISLWDKIRKDFINSQKWKTFKILIEQVKLKTWKGWTQNYIEANNKDFNIISWKIERNSIVKWILK